MLPKPKTRPREAPCWGHVWKRWGWDRKAWYFRCWFCGSVAVKRRGTPINASPQPPGLPGGERKENNVALSDKRITALNRRDQETKQVAGVTYKMIHAGQKRYKGDSIYEYEVESDLPPDQVEKVCTNHVRKCDLPEDQWREESKESMDNHFRDYYRLESKGGGKYRYTVIFPSTH